MTKSIKSTIDNGNYGCSVFVDLKKALNTVIHSILLTKMEHYGIRSIALNWLTSCLSDRKQYVSVNGHTFECLNISCGVPQGSVLGPLLFLIYINDLHNVSKHLRFYLFADDTNIYFEAKDLETLQKIMNRELRHVKKWFEAKKLALNIEEINFVVFHFPAKKLTEPIILKFGRKKITCANQLNFLGALLDEILSWRSHLVLLGYSEKACQISWYILQIKILCSTRYTYFYLLCFVLSLLDIWYCCLGCNI